MNWGAIAALGGAFWWLSRPNRNPTRSSIEEGYGGAYMASIRGSNGGMANSMRFQAQRIARYDAAQAAAKVKAAEDAEIERQKYSPIEYEENVEWQPHDFFMRPAGKGKFVRTPVRGNLGDRYRGPQERELGPQIAAARTEANRARFEERALMTEARRLGNNARGTLAGAIEETLDALGVSRTKVAAFLPENKRKWVQREVPKQKAESVYLGDDEYGDPIFSQVDMTDSEKRESMRRYTRGKTPLTIDPRRGLAVSLHTGPWASALEKYLAVQRTRWMNKRNSDNPETADEAVYYLGVLDEFDRKKRDVLSGAKAEEALFKKAAKVREAADARAEALAARLAPKRAAKKAGA